MKNSNFKILFNGIILIILLSTFTLNVQCSEGKTSAKKDEPIGKKERFTLANVCIQNTFFSNNECDILSPGPICSFGGKKIVLPKKSPKGLVAHWTFDDVRAIDSTGNRNHARNVVQVGPSRSGQGASAQFTGGEYLVVPYNESFNGNDYTITFWIFIIKDYSSQNKGIRYCPLMQRGKDDLLNKSFYRAPALYYDRVKKNIKLFVSTGSVDDPQGESITSKSAINPQRWMHIAIVKSENKMKLLVNGIVDSTINLKKEIIPIKKDDFYIGGLPWLKESCNYPFLIDEMRYYSLGVQDELIQAEAGPSLGEIDSASIALGGINVDITTAANSCSDGYHICTSIELHSGGYQLARKMGWLDWNTHLWSHRALKTPKAFAGMKGLALCCIDLPTEI